jgi:RNA polymerase sigma factor (sigma-70 family)
MAADPVYVLVHHVRALAGAMPGSEESDRELLQRFASLNDPSAFETLVLRHGPMVLRVCRRTLSNPADAEDVFQATFLVLASRASGVRWHDSIANWLFGVAHRLARKTNQAAARRITHEARVPVRSAPDPLAELSARELLSILDEELLHLPDRLREPLLLCYLEGLTRDEAAQRLGCPLGTLKSRLERGRDLLGRALTRRGIGLGAALAATLAVAEPGSAAVPRAILVATLDSVRTGASVSPSVRAIVEAAVSPMILTKMKVAIVLVLAGLITAGVALAGGAREKPKADPPPITAEQTPVRKPVPAATDALGDPLPPGALMRLGTRRHRVQNWPLTSHGLPDGRSYLIHQRLGSSSEVRRLDSATGRILETWPVPDAYHAVGISPDGRHMLLSTAFIFYTGIRVPGDSAKQEWTLTLYDLVKREPVWTKSEMLPEKDLKCVETSCFSADGKWIATTGRYDGELRVWDAATGKELWHHPKEPSLQQLGFTDGGNTLIARTRDGNVIHLFNRATGKELRSFPTIPEREAQQCRLAPDGSAVLFGRYGPTVRVWDIATGKERPPLDGHKQWARCIAFSRDGKTLATGGNDPFVLVRDWPSGKVVRTIEVQPRTVFEMAISGDGQRLEVLYWGEQALHFSDLKTGKALPPPLECHRSNVYGVAFTPDGMLLSFGKDSSVRTWDLKTRKATGLLAVEQDLNAGGFALSRDGRLLAVSNSDNKCICVHDRATGKLVHKVPLEKREAKSLVFSPDSRWLAGVESSEGLIRVWEIATGKAVLKLNDRVVYGTCCAFSPDGRRFAAAAEGKVRFWKVGAWEEQPSLTTYAPLGLAFSPDSRTLATGGVDGLRLFEVATYRERAHIRPPGYPWGGFLHFSRSGRWLAWQGSDRTTHVWDIHRGNLLGPFTGHDDSVTGLAFTPDERALASSSDDSTILIWEVAGPAAKQPPVKAGDVDQAWQALAGTDAKIAFDAFRVLSASPNEAVKRIAQNLRPAAPLDADRVAACLRDLDSSKFEVRVRATRDLIQMGEPIAGTLEQSLKGKPSLEVRRRIEEVLATVTDLDSPEKLQQLRALEVLERIGNDEARSVLKALAEGTPEARLTRDAKSALQRLSERPGAE